MLISDIIDKGAALFTIPEPDSRFGFRRVTREEVMCAKRDAKFIPARFAIYKALHMRGLSYTNIARVTGRFCHTTIISGVDRAEYMMERDPDYAFKVRYIYLMRDSTLPATAKEVIHYVFTLLDAPEGDPQASAVSVGLLRELGAKSKYIYNAFGKSASWERLTHTAFTERWADDELSIKVMDAAFAAFEGGING